jgi:hypothetical protein
MKYKVGDEMLYAEQWRSLLHVGDIYSIANLSTRLFLLILPTLLSLALVYSTSARLNNVGRINKNNEIALVCLQITGQAASFASISS